jgi:hypothetical protein
MFNFVEQRPGRLQIATIEAFGKPIIDGRKKAPRLVEPVLPEVGSRQACRRAQLPRQSALLSCLLDRLKETAMRL